MKRLLVLLLFGGTVCLAQTNYLAIEKTDGTNILYPIARINRISFVNSLTNVNENKLINKTIDLFKLYQNYPNPFNPSTTIEYTIPKSGLVEINIYNIQGKLIRVLDNSIHQAGAQKIIWNGKNTYGETIASGVYFYRIKFANNILVKKMMFLK